MEIKDSFKFYYQDPESGLDESILYTAEKQDLGFYKVSWKSPISGKIESTGYSENWVTTALEDGVWIIQE